MSNALKKVSLEKISSEITPMRPQVFLMLSDPLLQRLYRRELSNDGYCIVWYDERGDGWNQALGSISYDVIVVDLSIFHLDSIENLQEIRKLQQDAEIIVLSSSDDVRLAVDCFRIGISDYFLKPTNPESLSWGIDKILRKKEFRTQHEALEADLSVFRLAHQINVSTSDSKMRELTARHLIKMLNAEGGMWIISNDLSSPTQYEYFQTPKEFCLSVYQSFRNTFREHTDHGHETQLTSHPEKWFTEDKALIPLKSAWMGTLFIFGIHADIQAATQARVEFLIRNMEVSLENHRRYVEAKQLAYVDDLTGLFNSRYLGFALNAAIHQSKRNQTRFCVLFIDVDHFKRVNDQHGHLVGSALLVDLGHSLKKFVRRSDHVFRYGGDEFIAILYDTPLERGFEVAERIRQAIERQHFHTHQVDVRVTLSIGVASFPDHGRDKRKIIEMADHAMYQSKNRGRNTVFVAPVPPIHPEPYS